MSKLVNGILGHAIGDAVGVPVEFKDRESLMYNPVEDMRRSYAGEKGTWSDDTSMELATMDAFINNNGWNYNDIMINFVDWLNNNKFTAHNYMFDVGGTCLKAINNFIGGAPALESGLDDLESNGNGSLMRIFPVAYFCFYKNLKYDEIYELVKNISSLTHRHEISILGCYIYTLFIIHLLNGENKFEAYDNLKDENYTMFDEESLNCYTRILNGNLVLLKEEDISSKEYVVDTLEAAMWVFLKSFNYKETILKAVNLGYDTDTIAAIAGSMAGIVYGKNTFPQDWINNLARKEYIEELCNKFEKCLED